MRRAIAALAVVYTTSCVGEAQFNVAQCRKTRSSRDIWGGIQVGSIVLSGAGGIGAIAFTNPDHVREAGYFTLGFSVLSAVALYFTNATTRALEEEDCTAKLRSDHGQSATVPTAPSPGTGSGGGHP